MPTDILIDDILMDHYDLTEGERTGSGIFLDGVISPNGEIFDFFNKSHHISESAMAFMYEFPREGDQTADGRFSGMWSGTDLVALDNDEYCLNSNPILDLCIGNENSVGNFSPIEVSLGKHIDNLDNPPFYAISAEDVISSMDNGERFMFAVLLPMYPFSWVNGEYNCPYIPENENAASYPPRWGAHCNDIISINGPYMWQKPLAYSVDYGSRQWDSQQHYSITDYPDYGPGEWHYVTYYTFNLPGLVYECYANCQSNTYTVISRNAHNDLGSSFIVTRDQMIYILMGYQYGLQFLNPNQYTDWPTLYSSLVVNPFPGNNSKYWFDDSATNYRYIPFNGVVESASHSDRTYVAKYLQNMENAVIDENSYNISTELYNGEPIERCKFPIYIKSIGQSQTINSTPTYPYISGTETPYPSWEDTATENSWELDYESLTPVYLYKGWPDDSNTPYFRPDEITMGIYLYFNNQYYFLRTETLRGPEWSVVVYLPNRIYDGSSWSSVPMNHYNIWEYSVHCPERLLPYTTYPQNPDPWYSDSPYRQNTAFVQLSQDENNNWTASKRNFIDYDSINSHYSQQLPVHIYKVWDSEPDCKICHDTISVTIDIQKSPTTITIPPGGYGTYNISPAIGVSGYEITENNLPQGWDYYITFSENNLDWYVHNFKINKECETSPIDVSKGVGLFFYFEMDKECYSWNEADKYNPLVGFQVGYDTERGQHCPGDTGLCYQIAYHKDAAEDPIYDDPKEYDEFMAPRNWRQFTCSAAHKQDYNGELNDLTLRYDIPSQVLDGGPIVSLIGVVNNEEKARIYIGSTTIKHHTTAPFRIRFLYAGEKDEIIAAGPWSGGGSYKVPKKSGDLRERVSPIRCGGYLSSLYGCTADNLSGYAENNNYRWLDTSNLRIGNRVITNIKLNGEPQNSFNKVLPINLNTSNVFWNRIHTYRTFNLNNTSPSYQQQRYALADCTDYTGYQNKTSGVKGDLFDRMFEFMGCLVDASQLIIPIAYTDMQYHRTFASTGLGFTGGNTIKPKAPKALNALPQIDNVGYSDKVFAPFKDMYRGCIFLTQIYSKDLMLPDSRSNWHQSGSGEADLAGMHMFDSMFRDCSSLSYVDIWLPATLPWGACKGMFYGTNITTGSIGLPVQGEFSNIGGHAFRSMFSSANATLNIIPKVRGGDLNTSPFCSAFMYYNAVTNGRDFQLTCPNVGFGCYWSMFGHSDVGSCLVEATSYSHFSFGHMFECCDDITAIQVAFSNWYGGTNNFWEAHHSLDDWVKGIRHSGYFYKPTLLGRFFGDNRIPKPPKWTVTNT